MEDIAIFYLDIIDFDPFCGTIHKKTLRLL